MMWQIRQQYEVVHPDEAYGNHPTFFTMKINHGGFFSKFPGRRYLNGKVSHVDLIDADELSMHENRWNDATTWCKEIDFYSEHGTSNLNTYLMSPHASKVRIEQLPDDFLIEPTNVHSSKGKKQLLIQWAGKGLDHASNLGQGSGLDNEVNDLDDASGLEHGTILGQGSCLNDASGFGAITEDQCDEFDPFWGDEAFPNVAGDQDADEDHYSVEEDDTADSDYFMDEDDCIVEDVVVEMRNMDVDMNMDVDEAALDLSDEDSCSDDGDPDFKMRKRLRNVRLENSKQQQSKVHFYVGQAFGSRDEVKKMIKLHAIETRRDLAIVKNDLKRVRAVCRGKIPTFYSDVGCSSGGKQEKKTSCPWVVHISTSEKDESWVVKTFVDTHKCIQPRKIKLCTVSFLAQELVETIKPNPSIPVKAVQDHFQKRYQQTFSTMKCFRAKQMAELEVRGDYEQQYGRLRDYVMELQKTNEGTTVKLDVVSDPNHASPTRKFKRIYICLGALKKGFKAGLRDILGLDGTFMKGPFPGQLLTAVGVDANNGTYPLAYAVVEAETRNSWEWFLEYLGDDLDLGRRSNFTFISDRQKGIIPAIEKLYPNAEHRFCVRHIQENMKQKWKGKAFEDHVWKCAKATTIPLFDKFMEEFKAFNDKAHGWLKQIPPQHWSRAHFSGRSHCDVLLNNMCEVFNRRLIDARDQPIITALEYIREYLMKRITNVGKMIAKSEGPLTPKATDLFKDIQTEAAQQIVLWNGDHEYQVSGSLREQHVVNAQNKSCTCRKWELTGIPCKHAVAAIWFMAENGGNVGSPEMWVHPCYWLDTWKAVYSFTINPITGMDMWPKSSCPTTLTPPLHHKQIGRPKKKRKKSVDELSQPVVKGGKLSRVGKTVTCLKCKKKGHNSRTCKGQV
ncbi:hypothetical protein OSB04_027884 [Centaurea solstitialis]|uniref:SWIM-type domain-containing protein n=1 Tax=Centaurea solstitialis TaxID=347529 RepID=A0AA38SFG1_9ASTR|nr:hypothetical protein OSB04_027884 [Centaurea solstitialis]